MRLVVAGASAAAALALAATAHGELLVSGDEPALGRAGTITLQARPAGPSARLIVLVPRGFEATLGQPPGTALGRARLALAEAGPLEGALVAGDPAEDACGAAGREAVWRVEGDPNARIAVDEVGSADGDAAYAGYRIEACSTAGRLSSLELVLDRVLVNPGAAGDYTWRLLAVPADATGAPDRDAAVESRSLHALPVRLALRGSFARGDGEAVLSGSLTAGGRPLRDAAVRLVAGRPGAGLARAGSVVTGAQGRFQARRPITQATVFEASAEVRPAADPRGCPGPIAPGGCSSATLAGVRVTSERVAVRVPAPRTLRLGSRGADVRRLRAELVRLRFLPSGSRSARFDDRTWHAVVAFQGWRGFRRTGVVDRRTWRALASAGVPTPWARVRRGVLIDTARQVMLLVERGRTVRAIHVSTGAYGRTPRGRFSVYRKETLSWSVPFSVWMPYASYFLGGFAMHAYPSVPAYPASHGCVRVPPAEAPAVYRFARYGTPVWVR